MEYLRRHRYNMNQLLTDLYRYKDGDEIIPTRRTRLSYNDGVSSLFLSDLNLSDAGSYSCKAVNKFGHISTSSDLDIQGMLELYKVCFFYFISSYNCFLKRFESSFYINVFCCQILKVLQVNILSLL